MQTEHNRQQRRLRLQREIEHFGQQVEKFSSRATPEERRSYTIAERCLKRRKADLSKLG